MLFKSLDEAKAQLGEGVLDEPLFLQGEIAARFFLDHGQQIDAVARHAELGLRPFRLITEMQQPEVDLYLGLQRKDQEVESCRRQYIFLLAHLIHHFSWWRVVFALLSDSPYI